MFKSSLPVSSPLKIFSGKYPSFLIKSTELTMNGMQRQVSFRIASDTHFIYFVIFWFSVMAFGHNRKCLKSEKDKPLLLLVDMGLKFRFLFFALRCLSIYVSHNKKRPCLTLVRTWSDRQIPACTYTAVILFLKL